MRRAFLLCGLLCGLLATPASADRYRRGRLQFVDVNFPRFNLQLLEIDREAMRGRGFLRNGGGDRPGVLGRFGRRRDGLSEAVGVTYYSPASIRWVEIPWPNGAGTTGDAEPPAITVKLDPATIQAIADAVAERLKDSTNAK